MIKKKLSSWRSFDERILSQDGYMCSIGTKAIKDSDGTTFFVITAKVMLAQRKKNQEGTKYFRLWVIFSPDGSIFSAYCICKGGTDQGCKHLGAVLFELEDFLCNERNFVTSGPAYWSPKPTPLHKPMQLKTSYSKPKRGKRKITPYDNSWIDSFDPRPEKHRIDINFDNKQRFALKLKEIDSNSAILHYLPLSELQQT